MQTLMVQERATGRRLLEVLQWPLSESGVRLLQMIMMAFRGTFAVL